MKRIELCGALLAGVFSLVASRSILAADYVELTLLKSMQVSTDAQRHYGVDLEICGTNAYWAWGGNGLCDGGIVALDITRPDSPVSVGSISLGHSVSDTGYSSSRLYALSSHHDDSSGVGTFYMDVIGTQNPRQLTRIGRYESNLPLNKVYVLGEHAIVLSESNILVLNVSRPTNISTVATIPGGVAVLALNGTYGYGGRVNPPEIAVYDFATPSSPRTLGRVSFSDWSFVPFRSATVQNGTGYFGWGWQYLGGCFIVDLEDPLKPIRLGQFSTGCWLTSIAVVDGLAFLTPHHGIEVRDVRDPSRPEPAEGYSLAIEPWTHEARLSSNHWFVGHTQGLDIFRITVPNITGHHIANGRLNLRWHEMAKGMKLQRATSLTHPDWQDLLGSENTNAVSLPIWRGAEFFRLMKP